MSVQLREYEVVAKDRLNQCQHQATKIRDLETQLSVASADLDAAGKQALALQQQAVQAMDVRHTMQQMKDVMKQQQTAKQELEVCIGSLATVIPHCDTPPWHTHCYVCLRMSMRINAQWAMVEP